MSLHLKYLNLVSSSTRSFRVTLEGQQNLLEPCLVMELGLGALARGVYELDDAVPGGSNHAIVSLLNERLFSSPDLLNALVLLGGVIFVKVVNGAVGLLAGLLALGVAQLVSSLNLKCLSLPPFSIDEKLVIALVVEYFLYVLDCL